MEKYDVIIIGGGPGGLTAAIYASRADLKTVFIEKGAPGGKMVKTDKIENWSGDKIVTGPNLSIRMFDHAKSFDAKYKFGEVTKIDHKSESSQIVTLASGDTLEGKKVIIATGMVENIPESIEGIHEFENKGVSYCAICDGPLYKGGDVAVIGGGNSAIEEASYLSSVANSVKIFVRKKEELWAEKKLISELAMKKNVEIVYGEILKLSGNDKIEKAEVIINGKKSTIKLDAIFPYIGQKPVSKFVDHLDVTDKTGYIITNEMMETKIKGIFAVGDIRVKHIRQIATAVADGVIAGKIVANEI